MDNVIEKVLLWRNDIIADNKIFNTDNKMRCMDIDGCTASPIDYMLNITNK
jgi:hypothetical protein